MIPKSGNRFSDKIMRQEKAYADALTERLAGFVREIGIDVRAAELPNDTFLPGLDIRGGAILLDESRLAHPGDLLHEAGHLAVTDPAERGAPTLAPTAGDEMATLAWSYAALRHLHLEPEIVFHADGYKGGSDSLIEAFAGGGGPGLPLLQWYGMTAASKAAAEEGVALYPHMSRWLR
jgi:hypothetical protein